MSEEKLLIFKKSVFSRHHRSRSLEGEARPQLRLRVVVNLSAPRLDGFRRRCLKSQAV